MLQPLQFCVGACLAVMLLMAGAGCTLFVDPANQTCLPEGYVYYLDGAGGGALVNWSGGVRQGLREAGYNAFGEMFTWETGLGPLADQETSAEYKQGKGRDLARQIVEHSKTCPADPVHLIALSAGTAVAAYTLEALPDNNPVENVVLLGASVSSNHDLTQALRHIRGKLFIVTSSEDAVLKFLVPLTGTADRETGEAGPAGLYGFIIPTGASAETRRLYAEKVITVPWTAAFERVGNYGGHLDNVNPEFVRDYVAPMVMQGRVPGVKAVAAK
jgi:pimeloyl-ACP methyl ester carboxylesterase